MSDVRLTATLERDAVPRIAPDGRAVLELHLRIAGTAGAVAVRRYGQGPAAQQACHQAARHLRRGARVIVHASSMRIVTGRAPHLAHLAITEVDFIEHLQVHAVHEPREAANA